MEPCWWQRSRSRSPQPTRSRDSEARSRVSGNPRPGRIFERKEQGRFRLGTALVLSCRELASLFLVQDDGTRAAGRAFGAGAQRTNINLELLHGSAERVPVHAQLSSGFALIAPVFFEHGYDEALLKLTNRLRIEDVAFVHLKNECFQLIFHLLPRFRTFRT